MTQANIKTMQDTFAAFVRGDVPGVLDAVTADVSWGLDGRPQDIPMLGIHHGKDGLLRFFENLAAVQSVTLFEPKKYLAAEDKVIVWGRTEWVMQGNGVSGDNDWIAIATFRDGKISEFRGYFDNGAMIEAYRSPPVAQRAAE